MSVFARLSKVNAGDLTAAVARAATRDIKAGTAQATTPPPEIADPLFVIVVEQILGDNY